MRANGGAGASASGGKSTEQGASTDLDEVGQLACEFTRDFMTQSGSRPLTSGGEHLIFFDEILQAVMRRSCEMGCSLQSPTSPQCTMRSVRSDASFAVEDVTETMLLSRTLRDVLRGTSGDGEDMLPVDDDNYAIHGEDEGGGGDGSLLDSDPSSPRPTVGLTGASDSGHSFTVQDFQATIMASTLRELEGPLGTMSRNAQATLLGSTLFEYGGVGDDDERSLDWTTQSTISVNDGDVARFEASDSRLRSHDEQPTVDLLATSSFRTSSTGGAESPRWNASVPTVPLLPVANGGRRVHPGRLTSSESLTESGLESTARTVSPSHMDNTLNNDERTVGDNTFSLTARIADALLTEVVTPRGNIDAGVIELLQRLAVDAAALDQNFGGSIRHVRQLGAMLAGERLSSDEIEALPRIRFRDADRQTCAICLDSYSQGEFLTRLPCRHAFHVDCIADWLRRASRCPLCRAQCAS